MRRLVWPPGVNTVLWPLSDDAWKEWLDEGPLSKQHPIPAHGSFNETQEKFYAAVVDAGVQAQLQGARP